LIGIDRTLGVLVLVLVLVPEQRDSLVGWSVVLVVLVW
jgi:hypothetical protein